MDKETSLTAKRFAKAVKKLIDVDKIMLFGSHARSDNFVTSDYDFIVVSRNFSGTLFTRRASRLLDFWTGSAGMEALCYTPAEWHRLKDRRGILLNAQRDGVEIT